MDLETAALLVTSFRRAGSLCNQSLRVVMANESLGQAKAFGQLTAEFMARSYDTVLGPLWNAFPELEPPLMKEASSPRAPALSPATQEALRKFLDEAHAAMKTAEEVMSRCDTSPWLTRAELDEFQSTIEAVERFLATAGGSAVPGAA
jgi:hypothetical protein